MGEKLGKYEVEKRQAVENEDYDKAKLKKVQMDEYRLQIYKDLNVQDLLETSGVSVAVFFCYSLLFLTGMETLVGIGGCFGASEVGRWGIWQKHVVSLVSRDQL